jgi:hypothetical protein
VVISPNQERILRHIARYALTLRPVLDSLFYGSQTNGCEGDLSHLREKKLVTTIENAVADSEEPRTRYSYYQLTKAGAKAIGASEYRGKAQGGQAVTRSLAFLWFCCVKKPRRHRIIGTELAEIFGSQIFVSDGDKKPRLLLPGFHCLDKAKASYRVLHLYAPKTSVADTVVELNKRLRDVRQLPVVEQAIIDRQYAFAVLAETKQQQDALRLNLEKSFAHDPIKLVVTCSPGGSWRQNLK